MKTLLAFLSLTLLTTNLPAIVLYNPAAPGVTSAPADFAYWDNVIVVNGASGVYLGDGWVLTANHVGTPASLTIQGKSKTVDASTSRQINTADLRLFRVNNWEDITLPSINVYQGWQYTETLVTPDPEEEFGLPGLGGGNSDPYYQKTSIENATTGYAIGYGAGAGTPITGGYNWDTNYIKRWGIVPLGSESSPTDGNSSTITSRFDRSLGDYASSFALKDSGGGVFYQDENGWHLAGTISHVSDSGKSLYDRNPTASGDQPGYGLSQRLTGNNGLTIYRTTGIWSLPNTTGIYDGSTWTEGSINSLRVLASGTLTLEENTEIGLLETSSPTTITNQAPQSTIGTILTRGTSPLQLEGNFAIQALDAETGSTVTLKNGNFRIGSLSTQTPSLVLDNTSTELETSGGNLNSLTIHNSTLKHNSLAVKNLTFLGANNTVNNPNPLTVTILGTGESATTYYSILASESVHIAQGAKADTHGFRQGSNAILTNEGNLYIGENSIQSTLLYAQGVFFEDTSSLTLDIQNHGSDRIAFSGIGTVDLEGTLHLNILSAPLASQYTLFTYQEGTTINLLFQNLNQGRILSTNGEWSFLLTTTETTQNDVTTYNIQATDIIHMIPEPNISLLSLLGISLLTLHSRQRKTSRKTQ